MTQWVAKYDVRQQIALSRNSHRPTGSIVRTEHAYGAAVVADDCPRDEWGGSTLYGNNVRHFKDRQFGFLHRNFLRI